MSTRINGELEAATVGAVMCLDSLTRIINRHPEITAQEVLVVIQGMRRDFADDLPLAALAAIADWKPS